MHERLLGESVPSHDTIHDRSRGKSPHPLTLAEEIPAGGSVAVITVHQKNDYRIELQPYDIHKIVHLKAVSLRDAFIFHPSTTPPFPSVFSVRSRSILVSLHCIRMIICPSICYIVSVPKVSEPWSSQPVRTLTHPFLAHLMDSLSHQDTSDFALSILDAAFHAVLHAYDAQLFQLEHDAHLYAKGLSQINNHHNYMVLVEKVHEIKVDLSKINASAKEMKDELDTVLENDDSVSSQPHMICTRDSEQFEEILQSAYTKTNVAIRRLCILSEYIESRQMMARIALDAKRNQLFGLDLMISNLSMGFGYAGMIAGIWGMNLYNTTYQESKMVFVWVIASVLLGAVGLPLSIKLYMRSKRLNFLPENSIGSL